MIRAWASNFRTSTAFFQEGGGARMDILPMKLINVQKMKIFKISFKSQKGMYFEKSNSSIKDIISKR